jgi:hypothetical protein
VSRSAGNVESVVGRFQYRTSLGEQQLQPQTLGDMASDDIMHLN